MSTSSQQTGIKTSPKLLKQVNPLTDDVIDLSYRENRSLIDKQVFQKIGDHTGAMVLFSQQSSI